MTAASRLQRRLARRLYRVKYRLYRALFPTRVGAAPVDPRALGRVLVLANYFVGDLVVATPALAYLRRHAPQARVDVLTSARAASLFAGDPRVDRVLTHDGKRAGLGAWLALARRLRRERYDLVADFVLPHHLREGLLTAYVAGRGGARVTPYRPSRFAGLFTHRGRAPGFERRYMADRLLYAVRAALRVADAAPEDGQPEDASPEDAPPEDAAAPSLHVSDEAAARAGARLAALGVPAAGPFVALNAWASDPVRTLGVAQAAGVAAGVARGHAGLWVVVTPPPGADAEAAAIVGAARAQLAPADAARVAAAPSSPDLGELVALLARAAAVVTPDTANVHLAAALARPTVALYTPLGGTRMEHWAPRGPRHRAVAVDGRRPLAALPAAAVVAAFDALWDDVRPAPAPPDACAAESAAAGSAPTTAATAAA